jgi:N-acetylmuramoyl-L-alanine amidase
MIENTGNRIIKVGKRSAYKKSDSQGKIGLVFPQEPDTILLFVGQKSISLSTQGWYFPYKYEILSDMKVKRESPWLEFRRIPRKITNDSVFHFLCKTDYPAVAWLNGDTAKVYKTGIFFSRVILEEGANRVWAGSITADGQKAFYEQEFIYQKRVGEESQTSLWIDTTSIEPYNNIIMGRKDKIQIRFRGTKNMIGKVETVPAGLMVLCSRNDFEGYSVYEAQLSLASLTENIPYKLKFSIHSVNAGIDEVFMEMIPETTVTVRPPEAFPCVGTKNKNSIVSYNLGSVRLGGPFLGEYPSGIIFKTDAKIGGNYRVRLDEADVGYIDVRDVVVLAPSRAPAPYYIASISCGPSDSADIVNIPYLQPVPYAVFPEPDLNRIRIRIYGAMTSSTWISHRTGRKYVDKITWQQVRPETYDVIVNLYTSKIWGYDVTVEGRSLVLRLKYPPRFELRPEKPLDGIRIVIEAGHGGEGIGAEGLSGLPEKEVNLGLSLMLGSLLESAGAEILQVRATDTTMSLYDKRDIARFSGSDILISIHANAAGTRNGYLGVAGTSTYYHNPFWAKLAENVYDRLLELGLDEFGVVGSFNYTVTRVSQMPAILVEQAFMTHAEDEEKLADESFRRDMAGKIYLGILDYLKYMNE